MSEEGRDQIDDSEAAGRGTGWFDRHLGDEWEAVSPGVYRLRADQLPERPLPEKPNLSEALLDQLPRPHDAAQDRLISRRPRLPWARHR